MAKTVTVIVYPKKGDPYEVQVSNPDDIRFYEDMPFTQSNVMYTKIKE